MIPLPDHVTMEGWLKSFKGFDLPAPEWRNLGKVLSPFWLGCMKEVPTPVKSTANFLAELISSNSYPFFTYKWKIGTRTTYD